MTVPAEAAAWTIDVHTADADQTRQFAARLAADLRPGDMLILHGELGAGKTTFTQGLAQGLGVRPGITSPTFVLARVHPTLADGTHPEAPDLVHVDAYRLGSAAELEDLDLESSAERAVTVVEWGRDRAEHLSDSRLEITLTRARGTGMPGAEEPDAEGFDAEPRRITVSGFGPRWAATPIKWATC